MYFKCILKYMYTYKMKISEIGEINIRDWNNRKIMSDAELDIHKKSLVKKWNKKVYMKRKCNNRIDELENLIIDTYDIIDGEVLCHLFEELDILIEQRDDIVNNKYQ